MYQGPVKVRCFVSCDAEEAAFVIYRQDSRGNIVCENTFCLWAGPGEDFSSQKGTWRKVHALQKGPSQSVWPVCTSHGGAVCCGAGSGNVH